MDENQVKKAIRGDASSRIKGFLYQFMIALDHCFDLGPNESLYVETYGDLAIREDGEDSNSIHPMSMEIKMYAENDKLGIVHHNFLNTLYNWSEESFHFEDYKRLILFTTQSVGENDVLYEWNSKGIEDRYKLVYDIYNRYIVEKSAYLDVEKTNHPNVKHKIIETNIEQMSAILWSVQNDSGENDQNASKNRLKSILERVEILEKQEDYMSFYENHLLAKRAYWDPDRNTIFINALLGFIISPRILNSNWQISYEEFRKQLNGWSTKMSGQKMVFPSIEVAENPNVDKDALFLKKLKDIDWNDTRTAIRDFAKASKFIEEETAVTVVNSSFNKYKEDLMDLYSEVKGMIGVPTGTDVNAESRSFVNRVFLESKSIKMDIYEETDHKFARGVYHSLANEPDNDLIWKLQ